MEFFTTASLKSRKPADLLVLPFWKSDKQAVPAFDTEPFKKILSEPLASHDFHGKEGETMLLYVSGQPEKRLALIGLGAQADITVEIREGPMQTSPDYAIKRNLNRSISSFQKGLQWHPPM